MRYGSALGSRGAQIMLSSARGTWSSARTCLRCRTAALAPPCRSWWCPGGVARNASFVSSRARQDRCAMVTAKAAPRAGRSSAISSTRPAARAEVASRRAPAYSMRRAVARPTSCASLQFPPAPARMPSDSSGWAKTARGLAIRKSQASAISQPPPSAGPSTRAIVGQRCASSRSNNPALIARSA